MRSAKRGLRFTATSDSAARVGSAEEGELALVSIFLIFVFFFFAARIPLGDFGIGFVDRGLAHDVLLARPVAEIEQPTALAAERKLHIRLGIRRLPADRAVMS